jgi:hypothetical protein
MCSPPGCVPDSAVWTEPRIVFVPHLTAARGGYVSVPDHNQEVCAQPTVVAANDTPWPAPTGGTSSADGAVDLLAKYVRVARVPCQLLDHVHIDPAQ